MLRIGICDDEELITKRLMRILYSLEKNQSENYDIEVYTDSVKLSEKLSAGKRYDLIFLDHLMPNLDGIGTIKILKKMGNKIPVVAMTANVVTEVEEKYLKEGFDDYISKPINIKTLNKLLQKYFKKDKGE